MTAPAVEKYLSPKELAEELCQKHGHCLSPSYIRVIKRHTEGTTESFFILGRARVSDLASWIKAHPHFHRPSANKAA